ncbi:MAG TPA: hypothetical protein DCY20_05235 [Firmicutes bacterium]|nr:hypothetical protein [Bacillota bacterium]
MAVIYDFPTNYKEQLQKCDDLIEKGYVDQAICYIEDIDFKHYLAESWFLFNKKLLSCYVLKKEFEMCQTLIEALEQQKTVDLTVRAHDVLVQLKVNGKSGEHATKQKHAEELGVLSSYYKALLELIAELKAYYESYWMQEVNKKIDQLINETSVQEQFYILSDMQNLTVEELQSCQEELIQYFTLDRHPITKTLVAELLIKKELNFNVLWHHDDEVVEITLDEQLLDNVHNVITNTNELLVDVYELSDEALEIMNQQLAFFYQFICPFEAKIDKMTVINFFIQQFGIETEQKSVIIDSRVENKPIINYTTCKLRQYLLSLTSLI